MLKPPLPPCPVCGEKPTVTKSVFPKWWLAFCVDDVGDVSHDLSVGAPSKVQVCYLWRRVAGGRK